MYGFPGRCWKENSREQLRLIDLDVGYFIPFRRVLFLKSREYQLVKLRLGMLSKYD